MDRRDLGRLGERAVLSRYLSSGYRLVQANWRCRLGEIDLVLARGGSLVFCEVKTRRGTRLGAPFEAVDRSKQMRLRRLAEAFLSGRRADYRTIRFDVASVTPDSSETLAVHVFEDAF